MYPMPASWGPSEQELHQAAVYEISESVDQGEFADSHRAHAEEEEDDGDFDYGFHDSDSDQEGDLLEVAEAVAMTDAYHTEVQLDFAFPSSSDLELQDIMLPAVNSSPKKRKQM